MNKPLKTFEETLEEQMQDPVFRKGFLQAQQELDVFLRIRELRLSSGLSQEEVAQRMRTSQSALALKGNFAMASGLQCNRCRDMPRHLGKDSKFDLSDT